MNTLRVMLNSVIKYAYYKIVHGNLRALEYRREPKQPVSMCDHRISVLFILPYLNVGGVERATLNLISGLNRQKFRVFVITTDKSANPMESKFRAEVDAVIHLGAYNSKEKLYVISDFVGTNRIDVIHIQHSRFGYQAIQSLKSTYPMLYVIDTLHMEEPNEPWDYFRYSAVFKSRLDHRVVITNRLKQRLVSVYGENENRISVVENGIDCSQYRCLIDITAPDTLLFIGRMVDQKQPLQFCKIAYRLLQVKPKMRVIMIGGGPLLKKVVSTIKSLGISQYTQIHGEVQDIQDILKDVAGILVAPSLREGLPVVGIEAMCMGLPVVAAHVDGWCELIDSGVNGVLVETPDVERWVSEICRLVDSSDFYSAIRRQAREIAIARFDLHRMCRSYESIYSKCTSK